MQEMEIKLEGKLGSSLKSISYRKGKTRTMATFKQKTTHSML